MNYDEFAFFNQQLSAMLRDGIPLEGALRRLSVEMRRGDLKSELELLGADLAKGTPIASALTPRALPDFYKRLVLIGVRSDNLPGTLTMLADYYHRQNNLWVRLKGLMVYPLIVLFVVFVVSGLFVFISKRVGGSTELLLSGLGEGRPLPAMTQLTLPLMNNLWIFTAFFGLLFLAALAAFCIPSLRERLHSRLPAFKEANISRVAAGLNLLLRNGTPLPEAIAFVRDLEGHRSTASDLTRWLEKLRQGVSRFPEVAVNNRAFPPLFVWLVSQGGDNLAAGFGRAADLYQSRAEQRAEMALYAALPVAVMFLGVIIFSEAYLLLGSFLVIIDLLNNLGG
ncbi:MAG: type II secretion system F family protein [Akkermansiaceae bacterium]|nr:type II secretion system F family protein [Verrucomicrobiales bacterium]